MGLHICTAVARSLCVSWAFLYAFIIEDSRVSHVDSRCKYIVNTFNYPKSSSRYTLPARNSPSELSGGASFGSRQLEPYETTELLHKAKNCISTHLYGYVNILDLSTGLAPCLKGKSRQKWPIIFIGQIESAYFWKLFVIYFIKKFSLKSEVWSY